MGKIIETTYHDVVEKITSFNTDLINNSFYTFNDKKPTIVTYYNINKELSNLDPGSKLAYNNIGSDNPLRYNKIDDFILYGFTRIELTTENDEFGLEAEKITGECIVLPNTVVPKEGDYFEVDHVKDSTYLYIVTDVQRDTLENGSNAYKIQYKLEYLDHDMLQQNVAEEYTMIEKREGTNIVEIVQSSRLEAAKKMDKLAVMLKNYYCELFYNEKVQTFIYTDLTEWRVYDPYMIEFMIRNKILANGHDSFVYVDHKIPTPKTFVLNYDKTFYRAFEETDLLKLAKSDYSTTLLDIRAYGSIFYSRFEAYFQATYNGNAIDGYKCQCFPDVIMHTILDKRILDNDVESLNIKIPLWINILTKHFTDDIITDAELKSVEDFRFESSVNAFYLIPLLIYCLESAIEKALNEHVYKI